MAKNKSEAPTKESNQKQPKKEKNMSKTTTVDTKNKLKNLATKFSNGIIGIGKLLATVSMIASAVIVYNGTEGLMPKLIIAPMFIYGSIILVNTFLNNSNK